MKLNLQEDNDPEENDERILHFKLEAGNYKIAFSEFRNVKGTKTKKPKIRVYWDIQVPYDPKFKYRVWKEYPLEAGKYTKLKMDLKRIFGKDLSIFNDEVGNFDTDNLLGKEAEAKVGKKITNEYKDPLTVVERLYPVGTFNFDESPDSQIP